MSRLDEFLPEYDVRVRAYWLVVGPFSALVRRRWLAAAERALR